VAKVFLIIFLAVAAFFGYQQFERFQEKRRADLAAATFKELLSPFSSRTATSPVRPIDAKAYYRLLFEAREARLAGHDLNHIISLATFEHPTLENQAALIASSLTDALRIADELALFGEPGKESQNLVRLLDGDHPLIAEGAWAGQAAVPAWRISPTLAPEAAHSVANILIMPEQVADLHHRDMDGLTLELAQRFRSATVIDVATLSKIRNEVNQRPRRGQ